MSFEMEKTLSKAALLQSECRERKIRIRMGLEEGKKTPETSAERQQEFQEEPKTMRLQLQQDQQQNVKEQQQQSKTLQQRLTTLQKQIATEQRIAKLQQRLTTVQQQIATEKRIAKFQQQLTRRQKNAERYRRYREKSKSKNNDPSSTLQQPPKNNENHQTATKGVQIFHSTGCTVITF